MAVSITYEVSNRPGTEIPIMYRVLSVDGSETDRTQVRFDEVLAADPAAASSYITSVKNKISGLVSTFEGVTEPTSTLFEESSILMATLDIFVNSYSEGMLPPVAP